MTPVAFFHVDDALPVLRGWRDLNATAPRQATFTARVGESDASFLPADLRGRPLASVGFVWVGDPDEERRVLPSMQSLGRPVARIEELSYLQLQEIDDSIEGHSLRRYWKGHYLGSSADEAIQAYLLRGTPDGRGEHLPSVSLQAYGGAIAERANSDTAFGQRDAMFEFVASAGWSNPAEEARIAAARRSAAALEPFASGAYVNTLSDEGARGVARAYPPDKLARLTALKDAYDPGNVFHLNQNIRP